MTRYVLIFGLVLGTIMIGHGIYMINIVYHNPSFEGNDVVGYAAMLIVFSLSGVGIWAYRNRELGGVISLGKAFKAGALIAFLGSTVYVVVWLFYYYLVVPDFVDKYAEHVVLMAEKHNKTATEIATAKSDMEDFKEMYKNPIMVVLISYMEVLPIGLIVAFISSLILKRKAVNPGTN